MSTAPEVSPPVTVGFLKTYLAENEISDDVVVADASGIPFRQVDEATFDTAMGGQSVVSLK